MGVTTSPEAKTLAPDGKGVDLALATFGGLEGPLEGPLVMVNPGLLLFIRLAKVRLTLGFLFAGLAVFITLRPGGNGSFGEGREGCGGFEPTGGCILESITMYFWSLDAENDNVVPTLTFTATFRGTFNKTGLALGFFCAFTRIET